MTTTEAPRWLTANLSVKHPDTGEVVWLHTGERLPPWAAELVTNPDVLSAAPVAPPGTAGPSFYREEVSPDGRKITYDSSDRIVRVDAGL